MRAIASYALLFASAASVTAGVALFSVPSAFIVGGALLAAWSVFVVMEV